MEGLPTYEEVVSKNLSRMIKQYEFRQAFDLAVIKVYRTHPNAFLCIMLLLYIISIILVYFGIAHMRKKCKDTRDILYGKKCHDIPIYATETGLYCEDTNSSFSSGSIDSLESRITEILFFYEDEVNDGKKVV
ncbi:hypothetical protein VCUG_02222 [Vavraia culicis subsp. floridensis]|uniref:Uncharacterized protein n=1 Tax=Vavraia culicis (isolate floridensis) TaxID=948595 RepID=L2GRN2_VAVCU|nr:uncharacterized protein VCUG_02222 [Vavraia culicis subsp. floridensis]ELA46294.1 hypothetical protein VCUG_02222 [Vavraia culicis subsp. floridensis]